MSRSFNVASARKTTFLLLCFCSCEPTEDEIAPFLQAIFAGLPAGAYWRNLESECDPRPVGLGVLVESHGNPCRALRREAWNVVLKGPSENELHLEETAPADVSTATDLTTYAFTSPALDYADGPYVARISYKYNDAACNMGIFSGSICGDTPEEKETEALQRKYIRRSKKSTFRRLEIPEVDPSQSANFFGSIAIEFSGFYVDGYNYSSAGMADCNTENVVRDGPGSVAVSDVTTSLSIYGTTTFAQCTDDCDRTILKMRFIPDATGNSCPDVCTLAIRVTGPVVARSSEDPSPFVRTGSDLELVLPPEALWYSRSCRRERRVMIERDLLPSALTQN